MMSVQTVNAKCRILHPVSIFVLSTSHKITIIVNPIHLHPRSRCPLIPPIPSTSSPSRRGHLVCGHDINCPALELAADVAQSQCQLALSNRVPWRMNSHHLLETPHKIGFATVGRRSLPPTRPDAYRFCESSILASIRIQLWMIYEDSMIAYIEVQSLEIRQIFLVDCHRIQILKQIRVEPLRPVCHGDGIVKSVI